MKLLRLKLENFRQHRDSDIRFQEGMTAIVGANGTGKTTILEAITFAIYGVQRDTKESVKFFWAEPRSRLRVLLEFEFDGRTYKLERSGSDATLTDVSVEPHLVKATGLREVKATCERLLRLTYDQFKNSFCAEQKSLAFLQFNNNTRRQEQVGKMLGFDRLKLASEMAYKRGKHYRWQVDEIAKSLGDPSRLRSDLQAAKDELARAHEVTKVAVELKEVLLQDWPQVIEKKTLADEFFRLSGEASVFGGQAEALKASKKRAEDSLAKARCEVALRKELEPAAIEFEAVEAVVRELHALFAQEVERHKIESEIQRLETEARDLQARLTELPKIDIEAARNELRLRAAAEVAAATALRSAEAAWSKARQAAQAELSTADAERKQCFQALEKARDLVAKGICPECGQATTASFAERLLVLEKELKKAEDKRVAANASFTEAEARPKAVFLADDELAASQKATLSARDALTEAEKTEVRSANLRADLEARKKRSELLRAGLPEEPPRYDRARHDAAQERLRELRPKREDYLKLACAEENLVSAERAFEEAKREVDEARASYQRLMAEREKLPFENAAAATQAVVAHEDRRQRIAEAELQTKQAELAVKLSTARLEQAQEQIKRYEQAEANLNLNRTQALMHEACDREMKLLREELNSVIRPDLEARASENLSLLTNGRYPVLELDEEFNPTVIEDGISKQVISGGEEDVVALALRLALSELIQERQGRPMSLMVLDEVFGSLDADRRQAVLERLQSIKGRFEQILVISHIEEINQVADHCIFLTRDESSRSTVVGDLPLDTGELVLTS